MSEGVVVAVVGALGTVIGTGLGVVGNQRARRADVLVQTLTEVREYADDLREANRDCSEERDRLRSDLSQLWQRHDRLEAEVRELRAAAAAPPRPAGGT